VDKHPGNLCAVRLVRRYREDELGGAHQFAVQERAQDDPAAFGGVAHVVLVDGARIRLRERLQVADRRATGNTVGEDGGERVELLPRLGRREPADIDLIGRGHAPSLPKGTEPGSLFNQVREFLGRRRQAKLLNLVHKPNQVEDTGRVRGRKMH
jgi:hypothetical protein